MHAEEGPEGGDRRALPEAAHRPAGHDDVLDRLQRRAHAIPEGLVHLGEKKSPEAPRTEPFSRFFSFFIILRDLKHPMLQGVFVYLEYETLQMIKVDMT